jgi:hypothetical protein
VNDIYYYNAMLYMYLSCEVVHIPEECKIMDENYDRNSNYELAIAAVPSLTLPSQISLDEVFVVKLA